MNNPVDPPDVKRLHTFHEEDVHLRCIIVRDIMDTVNEETRRLWLLDAAKGTMDRLVAMRKAQGLGAMSVDALQAEGIPRSAAENIIMALDQYGQSDSTPFLKAIEFALRSLLPDRNIDFGLPGDILEGPEEIDMDDPGNGPAPAPAKDTGPSGDYDKEDLVLRLLKELDDGSKGALREDLENRCAEEGISSMELEELIESLLDKGLAYEPNLKYIKRIDD